MVDVFVSYAREDAPRVEPLVTLLEARGLEVWWDRDLAPGSRFEEQIESAIDAAACVLIALTRHAAQSDWMRAEAAAASAHGKVIPVLLDDVPVPLSLRALQVADLRRWPGEKGAEADRLVLTIASRAAPTAPARPFVGRADTLHTLQKVLSAALEGNGGLVLLSGEPGIGKTRSAEEFARIAEDQGALVLWGRCYEQPGAPAYWPWVQILREFVDAHTDDELRILIGSNASVLVALMPELDDRLGVTRRAGPDGSVGDNQFGLFDAVARTLARGAANVPIVIVIDDLHWADASSLTLLEHIAKENRRQRCLLLCTYRDVEVTRKSPLLATLGELARSGRADRVRLTGLSTEETAELSSALSGMPIPPAAAEAIHQQTDGNPLFVREVAHVLAQEHRNSNGDIITVDVPDGIREAIGRSLDRLDAQGNEILSVASVLGRSFELGVVAQATRASLAACMAAMDAASRAGLVECSGGATHYRFTHAVVRETLYAEIPTIDRLELHRRIADTIAAAHAANLDDVLAQLAYHYEEAAGLGDARRAIEFALRAAEHAEGVFAGEEALRHYEDALRLLRGAGRAVDPLTARCLVSQVRVAATLGRYGEVVETCNAGIDVARRLDDALLFDHFVHYLVRGTSYAPQHHAIALVEEALRLLPPDDLRRRAVTLAHLAFAQRSTGNLALVSETAAESARLAREHCEPAETASALRFLIMGLRGDPATLEARLRYGTAGVALLGRFEPVDDTAEVMYWQLLNLIEAGQISGFAELLDRYLRFAAERNFHRHRLQAQCLRIVLQHLQGRFDGLEALIESAREIVWQRERDQERYGGEGAYGAQMFAFNRDTGRLRDLAPLLQHIVTQDTANTWAPGLMALCVEIGAHDKARTVLEAFARSDFADVPRDDVWPACMVYCAETCTALGDAARATTLHALLLPYAGQTLNHPTAVCFGAADHYLGLLAHAMGRTDLARGHFARATDMHRAMGAWPALARTLLAHARVLLASESDEERTAGRSLVGEAEQLAERLGMKGLLADIAHLLDEDAGTLPDGLTPREVEVLKLLAIGRSNKDISKALSISLSTVATHVRSILTKSGSANRTEAAAYAMRQQLT